MIDEKDLNSPTDNDGFADDSSDNEAFRLESLERYPDAVPFEFDDETDEPEGNSDDSAQLPPATLAAIKSDLDKSRRRKAKPDTLALSLDRLRKVLHTTSPEEAEFTIESDPLLVDPLAGKPEFSSTDITISERPVITERKPVKTTDDDSLPDLEEADPAQGSKSEKTSKKKNAGPPKNSSKKKRRALPVIPIIVGVGFLVASVGGYLAYKAINSRSGGILGGSGAAESTAANQSAGSTSPSSEKTSAERIQAEASAESRSDTPTLPEALAQNDVQSPSQPHATGKSETSPHAVTPSHTSAETSTSSVSLKQSSTNDVHAGAAAHTGSSGSHTTAHGSESMRHATAQHSHQTSKQSAKQTEHTVLQPKVSAPNEQHKQNSVAHASTHLTPHTSPEASNSKKTPNAAVPVSTPSHRESSNARRSAAMTAKSGGAEDHKREQTQSQTMRSSTSSISSKSANSTPPEPRNEVIPAPRVNLKSGNASTAQFSVQVFSTLYRQDAERRLQLLQGRSISGGYITEQQVRGRIIYNVRFGIFRTKEDAESALMRHAVSGGSICRLR